MILWKIAEVVLVMRIIGEKAFWFHLYVVWYLRDRCCKRQGWFDGLGRSRQGLEWLVWHWGCWYQTLTLLLFIIWGRSRSIFLVISIWVVIHHLFCCFCCKIYFFIIFCLWKWIRIVNTLVGLVHNFTICFLMFFRNGKDRHTRDWLWCFSEWWEWACCCLYWLWWLC